MLIEATGGTGRCVSGGASILPYLPLCIALVVVGVERLTRRADRVTALLVIIIFIGVLVRQYLTIRDNVALTRIWRTGSWNCNGRRSRTS